MDPDEVPQLLMRFLRAAEWGHWRAVLQPPGFDGHAISGPGHVVRSAMALRLVARSMQLQAQGRLVDAWEMVSEAAGLLPRGLHRRDPSTGVTTALLPPLQQEYASIDEELVIRLSRLVWREQAELLDLQRRFAPGRMRPRDELVEGCVQYFIWVTHDPTTYLGDQGEAAWDDGVVVEPTRSLLCRFGTHVRWLADPTQNVGVSQAVWQDIGAYRRLAARALDCLAARPAPAPWCGAPGTAGLVPRRGRLRAWEDARRRREDLVPR